MPWDVLADTVSGLARGMQSVDPEAELIAWPYGQSVCWGAKNTVKSAGHMPKNVILQHNFETGGRNVQLGKGRPTWDYWLSYVGPSELFRNCAKAAVRCGTRVSATRQEGKKDSAGEYFAKNRHVHLMLRPPKTWNGQASAKRMHSKLHGAWNR